MPDYTFSADDKAAMLADAQTIDPTVTASDIDAAINASATTNSAKRNRLLLWKWKLRIAAAQNAG